MRVLSKTVAAGAITMAMAMAIGALPVTTASAGVVSPYCQSATGGSTSFTQSLQCRLQQGPAAQYGYTGPIDGVFGVNSWKGIQNFLKANYGYTGPADGVPGTYTYRALQRWAADTSHGGTYTGPIDGVLGVNSWTGVDRAVTYDYYSPGARLPTPPPPPPTPTPTPTTPPPTPTPTPTTPPPTPTPTPTPTPPPTPPRRNGATNTVIFIHGYGDANCDAYWSTAKQHFGKTGWTGTMVTYGYYAADRFCTRVYPSGTTDTSIKEVGKDLAWYIYDYSRWGKKVDVVAHSMGGLIIRSALTEVHKKTAEYPPYLFVEDVVTLGTPHNGALWCCTTKQAWEMKAGSDFLKGLAARPGSEMGTDWTNIGSLDDNVVKGESATAMIGQHRILYHKEAQLSHEDLIEVTSGIYRAKSAENGAVWSAYVDRVNPVQLAKDAVYYSAIK